MLFYNACMRLADIKNFFWVAASHIPCCGPLVLSAVLGVHIVPSHNPYVELALAIIAPVIGLTLHDMWHKHQEQKNHHHHEHNHHGHTCPSQKSRRQTIASYAFWIALSCAIMALHQMFVHH